MPSRPALASAANFLSARFQRLALGPVSDHLASHLARKLRLSLSLTEQESYRASALCQSALSSHLNSIQAIDRMVDLVTDHFDPEDVKHNPQIFLLNYKTLRARLHVLKELSVTRPPIAISESIFKSFLSNSVRRAKLLRFCHPDQDVASNLLQSVDPYLREDILPHIRSEELSLQSLRETAISLYLALKLEIPKDMALEVSRNKRILLCSLSSIVNTQTYLQNVCHIPTERFVSNPELLTTEMDNMQKLVRELPSLAGQSFLEVATKYPKLLQTKFTTYSDNLRFLEQKFSSEQILNTPLVLSLGNDTLRSRVEALEEPELRGFRSHKRVLRLVLHMRTVRKRLEYLRTSGRTQVTLDQLIGDKKYFERILLSGHRETSLSAFAAQQLTCDLEDMRQYIGKHPLEKRFDPQNALKVLDLFQTIGMTRQQICCGLTALLYDYQVVRQRLESVIAEHGLNANLGQLVVYFIEKEFGFSGTGVYSRP